MDYTIGGILRHSAKGSVWENHKYIKKKNGIYYYPGQGNANRVTDGEQVFSSVYDGVSDLLKKYPGMDAAELIRSHWGAVLASTSGLDPNKISKDQLDSMQRKALEHYTGGWKPNQAKKTGTVSKEAKNDIEDKAAKRLSGKDIPENTEEKKDEQASKKASGGSSGSSRGGSSKSKGGSSKSSADKESTGKASTTKESAEKAVKASTEKTKTVAKDKIKLSDEEKLYKGIDEYVNSYKGDEDVFENIMSEDLDAFKITLKDLTDLNPNDYSDEELEKMLKNMKKHYNKTEASHDGLLTTSGYIISL